MEKLAAKAHWISRRHARKANNTCARPAVDVLKRTTRDPFSDEPREAGHVTREESGQGLGRRCWWSKHLVWLLSPETAQAWAWLGFSRRSVPILELFCCVVHTCTSGVVYRAKGLVCSNHRNSLVQKYY